MKPGSTDSLTRQRRQALVSAAVYGLGLLSQTGLLLWVRYRFLSPGILSTLLLVLALASAAALIPLGLALWGRLREIEGGEIDEARQY
jgi:hypothetical protein